MQAGSQSGQRSSDFKLGYYFRGIDRHEQKLQAKLNSQTAELDSKVQDSKPLTSSRVRTQQVSSSRGRFSKLRRSWPKKKSLQCRQQRVHCCGVPVHLVVAACMGTGCIAVLGVFVALPLYLYLDRFPHVQC